MPATNAVANDRIAAVRRFNRFYKRRIGVLDRSLLGSRFSLIEARLLYEIGHRPGVAASALCEALGLDPGYLSRMLHGFIQDGLVVRGVAEGDARRRPLSLTLRGRHEIASLDRRSRTATADMLAPLDPADQARLVAALATAEALLEPAAVEGSITELRPHMPGDLGWIVEQHGWLYAREYDFDTGFEVLVARIAADFLERHDPARERCWLAVRGGSRVGAVMLAREDDLTARLRLLIVLPEARGHGVGRELVEACIAFARAAGYRRLVLWTNSLLLAARRLYESRGFRLVETTPHHSFGHDLIGEEWALDLASDRAAEHA